MLANERVMTIARSSPAGDTTVTSARRAIGLSARQVTAIVGWPPARAASTAATASEVEPEREMTMIGSATGVRAVKTPDGRSSTSDTGTARNGRPTTARATAATTWAR